MEAFPEIEVWRITFHPQTADRYFVGTRPAALFRTQDGGGGFERRKIRLAETCPAVQIPRVTSSITIDPECPDVMFSTIEVDGVGRSRDGGDSWDVVMEGITTPVPNANVYGELGRRDCHYSVISAAEPKTVLVSTPDGLYESQDGGESWCDFPVPQVFEQQYHREIAVKLDDPDNIFQGTGDFVNGQDGALLPTRDRGRTWVSVKLPGGCNSPVWCFAAHPLNPDRILACTHKGQLFGSEDGGESFVKFRREFSEVRSICWLPNGDS